MVKYYRKKRRLRFIRRRRGIRKSPRYRKRRFLKSRFAEKVRKVVGTMAETKTYKN